MGYKFPPFGSYFHEFFDLDHFKEVIKIENREKIPSVARAIAEVVENVHHFAFEASLMYVNDYGVLKLVCLNKTGMVDIVWVFGPFED